MFTSRARCCECYKKQNRTSSNRSDSLIRAIEAKSSSTKPKIYRGSRAVRPHAPAVAILVPKILETPPVPLHMYLRQGYTSIRRCAGGAVDTYRAAPSSLSISGGYSLLRETSFMNLASCRAKSLYPHGRRPYRPHTPHTRPRDNQPSRRRATLSLSLFLPRTLSLFLSLSLSLSLFLSPSVSSTTDRAEFRVCARREAQRWPLPSSTLSLTSSGTFHVETTITRKEGRKKRCSLSRAIGTRPSNYNLMCALDLGTDTH